MAGGRSLVRAHARFVRNYQPILMGRQPGSSLGIWVLKKYGGCGKTQRAGWWEAKSEKVTDAIRFRCVCMSRLTLARHGLCTFFLGT